MPFFYDMNKGCTSNGSAGVESTHLWGNTVANQETVGLYGVYAASRFLTAGGAQINVKTNSSALATGGSTRTPQSKNLRGNPAAQSTWKDDTSAITAGSTLTTRCSIGFAQTGGMGGYIPIVPNAALQMMPNSVNPADLEFTSNAASNSVTFALTVDIGEGL